MSPILIALGAVALGIQALRCFIPSEQLFRIGTLATAAFVISLLFKAISALVKVGTGKQASSNFIACGLGVGLLILIIVLSLPASKAEDRKFSKEIGSYEAAVSTLKDRGLIPKSQYPKVIDDLFPECAKR